MNSSRPVPMMSHAPVPAPSGLHLASAIQPPRETSGGRPIPGSRRVWHVLASVLILAVALLSAGPNARAADARPPELMTYQGFLVDANGDPLASANPQNYPVKFRVYSAATGGVGLWAEQQIVTVDKGRFSVLLGEGNPLAGEPSTNLSAVFSGAGASERYMELTVKTTEGDRILLPRLQMLPAPYAFLARSANQLVNSAGVTVLNTSDGTLRGDGSGLTGLLPSQIPNLNANKITAGRLSAERLPATIPGVALLNGGNTFNGNQVINGSGEIDHLNVLADSNAPYGAFLSLDASRIAAGNKYLIFATGGTAGEGPGKLVFRNHSMGNNIMTLDTSGVGIGTTTPEAKLQVIGELKFGESGDQFAVGGGEESLRIVRGKVSASGTSRGAGWSSAAPANSNFTITFSPPFKDTPVLTVTPKQRSSEDPIIATYQTITPNSAVITTWGNGGDRLTGEFNFVAIGAR